MRGVAVPLVVIAAINGILISLISSASPTPRAPTRQRRLELGSGPSTPVALHQCLHAHLHRETLSVLDRSMLSSREGASAAPDAPML